MLNFVYIFVEGDADVKFIADYIGHIVSNVKVVFAKSKTDKGKAEISVNDVHKITIHGLGGWKDIKNVRTEIERNTENSGTNLIIFDADSIENDGGFSKRIQEIEDRMKGLSYEVFLFPNNQDDGAFEDLLEKIINEINTPIFHCWNEFENCLQEYASNKIGKKMTTPAKKSKIYVYLESLVGKTNNEKAKIKDPNRDYKNTAHWNLNADYLSPLKVFLEKNLLGIDVSKPDD